MKDNLSSTPSETFNTIEKRKILDIYMRWKDLKELEKSQLEQFKIQQIITNEMKVVFGCTCTLKDYVGVQFKNSSERKESRMNEKVTSKHHLVTTSRIREQNTEIIPILSQI
jgi:hypothetical protein